MDGLSWAFQNFSNGYRNWAVRAMEAEDYTILFDILHDVEFVWCLPEDERRESDGRHIRDRYVWEDELAVLDDGWLLYPASFLEVLISLSYQMESILHDTDVPTSAAMWFHELLANAQLDICTDEALTASDRFDWSGYINETVNRIMERGYDYDGFGGLFPLEHPRTDQRRAEIWCQLLDYCNEKIVEKL